MMRAKGPGAGCAYTHAGRPGPPVSARCAGGAAVSTCGLQAVIRHACAWARWVGSGVAWCAERPSGKGGGGGGECARRGRMCVWKGCKSHNNTVHTLCRCTQFCSAAMMLARMLRAALRLKACCNGQQAHTAAQLLRLVACCVPQASPDMWHSLTGHDPAAPRGVH